VSEKRRLKIVIINGSVRPGNYTAKASALVADELGKDPDVEVEIIDPSGLELPPPGVDPKSAVSRKLQESVQAASGVVCPRVHLEQLLREGAA